MVKHLRSGDELVSKTLKRVSITVDHVGVPPRPGLIQPYPFTVGEALMVLRAIVEDDIHRGAAAQTISAHTPTASQAVDTFTDGHRVKGAGGKVGEARSC